MRDLNHPSIRAGGEWMLIVMLLVVLTILVGGAVVMVHHLAAHPTELAMPTPTEPFLP